MLREIDGLHGVVLIKVLQRLEPKFEIGLIDTYRLEERVVIAVDELDFLLFDWIAVLVSMRCGSLEEVL